MTKLTTPFKVVFLISIWLVVVVGFPCSGVYDLQVKFIVSARASDLITYALVGSTILTVAKGSGGWIGNSCLWLEK